MSASQLISNMICMNYDHNKKFGLLKFHSGYGKLNLNSPKGYSLKIINTQTALGPINEMTSLRKFVEIPYDFPSGKIAMKDGIIVRWTQNVRLRHLIL